MSKARKEPVGTDANDPTSQLLLDYRDRYKEEWGRRDRILRELQLLLVIAAVEIPALVAIIRHGKAALTGGTTWAHTAFGGSALAALLCYGLGAFIALRVLYSAKPYRYLVDPKDELKHLNDLREWLQGVPDGSSRAVAEFTAWRLKVYSDDATFNAGNNKTLNERLNKAKLWILLSIPATSIAGLITLLE